jgi:hypothetical protein
MLDLCIRRIFRKGWVDVFQRLHELRNLANKRQMILTRYKHVLVWCTNELYRFRGELRIRYEFVSDVERRKLTKAIYSSIALSVMSSYAEL